MRAAKDLGNRTCMGEAVCTTDPVKGMIATPHAKRQGWTLENYCHNKPSNIKEGIIQGCPLFPTKPDNVPQNLLWAIELAEQLRKYKKRGYEEVFNQELTAVEFACFDAAEEAAEEIQSEAMEEVTNKNKPKGVQTPLGTSGEIDPHESAMKDW